LMSRRWQDRRYALRMPANQPMSAPRRVRRLGQNLTDCVLLRIIRGTIGWRVAYSLLRAIDSIRSMGIVPSKETGGGLKLVLGLELGLGDPRAESYLGMPHLTYRGLVRQIRGMVRVALPQTRAAGGNGWSCPRRYRYSAAPGIAVFLEEFETRLRQGRGVTGRVKA
jgi:hypothetical protein